MTNDPPTSRMDLRTRHLDLSTEGPVSETPLMPREGEVNASHTTSLPNDAMEYQEDGVAFAKHERPGTFTVRPTDHPSLIPPVTMLSTMNTGDQTATEGQSPVCKRDGLSAPIMKVTYPVSSQPPKDGKKLSEVTS